ncbi:MAG: SPOR domain-containing protein, partial [Thermodesulfobacteriota bacterium]
MYRVKERDTLTKIAARDFAFGDGEQWRRIYNCNFDVTHNPDVIYPNQVLLIPPLKIVRAAGADEMKEVPRKVSPEKKKPLKKVRREGRWAIHIGSYLYRSEADRVAMILRSGGDNAYITEFDSKGTHWYRVRVGFFASKQEAASYAQELSTQLKEQDLWVVLPSRREVTSFRDRIKKEDLNNI